MRTGGREGRFTPSRVSAPRWPQLSIECRTAARDRRRRRGAGRDRRVVHRRDVVGRRQRIAQALCELSKFVLLDHAATSFAHLHCGASTPLRTLCDRRWRDRGKDTASRARLQSYYHAKNIAAPACVIAGGGEPASPRTPRAPRDRPAWPGASRTRCAAHASDLQDGHRR